MSKPPEQLHAPDFFDGVGITDEYNGIIGLVSNGPLWVRKAMHALGSGQHNIMSGTYKVAIIDKDDKGRYRHVYTLEILAEKKMLQKEQTYAMLSQIAKLRVKLPLDTYNVPINESHVAYFTLTDYCNEVFDLIAANKKILNKVLEREIVRLMETYRTLCDNNIFLVDIKPENMLLCADGLYFIDVDDVSVVRDDFIRISLTRTPYYSTTHYDRFLSERENFALPEIRERLEYEGWQALVKTYFFICKNGESLGHFDQIKKKLIDINKNAAQRFVERYQYIGRFFVFILDENNLAKNVEEKNWKIRAWLENVQSTSQPMDLGLTAIKHLRF